MILRIAAAALLSVLARAACVNAGGPVTADCLGDAFFVTSPGSLVSVDTSMGAAELADLRYAPSFSYVLPAAPGFWTVTLTMVEPNKTAAGQRVFTVTVNGIASAEIDLFKAAGLRKAYKLKLFAVSNGTLRLDFRARVHNALVNKIEWETAGTAWDLPEAYEGPIVLIIDKGVPRPAMLMGGISVTGEGIFPQVSLGEPTHIFNEILNLQPDGFWRFPRYHPNPATGAAVYLNGVRLRRFQFRFVWTDNNSLPDRIEVVGSVPSDVVMVDYIAGSFFPVFK